MLSAFAALRMALHVLTQPVRSRLTSDDGIEIIEYALIGALVAVAVIAAVALLNPGLTNIFTAIGNRLTAEALNVTN